MKPVWVAIVVAFMFASCARQDWIDRTLVTESVAGTWSGTMTGASRGAVVLLELQQQGAKVTGVINMPAYGASFSGRIDGNVAGDVFTFKDDRGAYSGELTVAGDDMVGQISGPRASGEHLFAGEARRLKPTRRSVDRLRQVGAVARTPASLAGHLSATAIRSGKNLEVIVIARCIAARAQGPQGLSRT